jgi:hypothetical protein
MTDVERQRKIRKERREKGLCSECGINPRKQKANRCKSCTKQTSDNNRKRKEQWLKKGLCGKCGKNKLIKGCKWCDQCRQKNRNWYKNSNYREENRKKDIIRRRNRKQRILKHYGDRCACCGLEQYEFLCIDHIEGGGNEHRRSLQMSKTRCGSSSTGFYKWLEKNNYPEGFQVLCHNCNMAKSIYGICPHQQKGNQ